MTAEFDTSVHCQSQPNDPSRIMDFSRWSGPRWPPLFLLGAQKAATTSVATVLALCGLVSFGIPDERTGLIETCRKLHVPCKETLHPSIDLNTHDGRLNFEHLYCTSATRPLL